MERAQRGVPFVVDPEASRETVEAAAKVHEFRLTNAQKVAIDAMEPPPREGGVRFVHPPEGSGFAFDDPFSEGAARAGLELVEKKDCSDPLLRASGRVRDETRLTVWVGLRELSTFSYSYDIYRICVFSRRHSSTSRRRGVRDPVVFSPRRSRRVLFQPSVVHAHPSLRLEPRAIASRGPSSRLWRVETSAVLWRGDVHGPAAGACASRMTSPRRKNPTYPAASHPTK